MATRLEEAALAAERERIRPYVARLQALVRRFDPEARFSLQVGHMPEFWELDARVRPELTVDDELRDAVANLAMDIQLEHDAAIAVLLLPRRDQIAASPPA